MSASLVGSEMCIRDRSGGEGRPAPWACWDGGLLGLGSGPTIYIFGQRVCLLYTSDAADDM
eukprot:13689823-Alexandrium_andersonii.AAC.1